jgi:hypothetical protein
MSMRPPVTLWGGSGPVQPQLLELLDHLITKCYEFRNGDALSR